MKREGFTLIELMTVIGILGVLAAILLPCLGAATGRAQSINCCSNLRQLHLAFSMYAGEHRNRLPPYVGNNLYLHGGVNWARYTYPYYREVKLLECPSSLAGAPTPSTEGFHLYDGNYGWNYDGTQYNRGPLNSCIKNPSQGYLLFDSGDQCVIYGANTWENLMEELDLDFDSHAEGTNRHASKTNIVFVDGHCGSRKLKEFLAAPNPSFTAPWYIEWTDGCLQPGVIPFPDR